MTLGSLAVAAPRAKPPSGSQDAALRIKRGIGLFNDGDFGAALVQFRAAQRAAPSWDVLYHLGRCERRLNKFGDAIKDLEAYLSQGGAQVPNDRRDLVAKELSEIRALTAAVTITVPGAPAAVTIDGEPMGDSPFSEPFILEPGKKVFSASREGQQPAKKTEELRAGTKVAVVLSPAPQQTAAPAEGQRHAPHLELDRDRAERKSRFPLVGTLVGAAGVLAIGGGVALNLSAKSRAGEVNGLFTTGGRWDAYYDAVQARGQREEAWGLVAGLGGGAALLTGAILILVSLASEPSEGEDEPVPVEEARLFLAPVVGGGLSCGLSFRW